MKHPNWKTSSPALQLQNIRRRISYLVDAYNREGADLEEDFSLEMQNFINELAHLQPYVDGTQEWDEEIDYKMMVCSGPNCDQRRIHHERQDTPRGTQFIEVPKSYTGERAFCSLTCKMYYEGQNETPKT